MFKVGDEVLLDNKLFTIKKLSGTIATMIDSFGPFEKHISNLKPRYEVKYLIFDNLDGGRSQLFDTEQQAFELINKPRVNVGERWEHSDGTIVRISSKEGDTIHTRHDSCGRNVLLSFTSENFLEEFTKCES